MPFKVNHLTLDVLRCITKILTFKKKVMAEEKTSLQYLIRFMLRSEYKNTIWS